MPAAFVEFPGSDRVGRMQSASAAGRTFGAVKGFVDDLANSARATATLSAAAKTAIDVTRRTARRGAGSASHFVVSQHVAGTYDHRTPLLRVFANWRLALSQNKIALYDCSKLQPLQCFFRAAPARWPTKYSRLRPLDGFGDRNRPPRHIGMQTFNHSPLDRNDSFALVFGQVESGNHLACLFDIRGRW